MNMTKVYISPVCHLVKVATQMNICQAASPSGEILVPTPEHIAPQYAV